jgi:hypothetical protein
MEAACSSEISVAFKRNARCYFPEDRTLFKEFVQLQLSKCYELNLNPGQNIANDLTSSS